MIYITGDCHGDFKRFNMKNFPEQRQLTRNDYVIILGDFGGIWSADPRDSEELYWLKWLANKNFTILFLDGNHENFDRLNSGEFPEIDFLGGRAHKIRDNIYHLMRGYVFNIEGFNFFVFGGASSHDVQDGILHIEDFPTMRDLNRTYNQLCQQNKMVRIEHISWWPQELPTQEEMNRGMLNLERYHYNVDFVLTHCLPHQYALQVVGAKLYEPDSCNLYLQQLLMQGIQYKHWFCGHYHEELEPIPSISVLYDNIYKLNGNPSVG